MRDTASKDSAAGLEAEQRSHRLGEVAEYLGEEDPVSRSVNGRQDRTTSAGNIGWRRRVARWGRRVRTRAERWRAILLEWRGRMHAHPLGKVGAKLVIALLGTLVIAVGVILLPLPGPGWVIILGGLAILAIEFHWARRLLRFTRAQLRHWTKLAREGSWLVRILSVLSLVAVVGLALWLSYHLIA